VPLIFEKKNIKKNALLGMPESKKNLHCVNAFSFGKFRFARESINIL
jgi:hypothetical protein